jgi:hypothetical protein
MEPRQPGLIRSGAPLAAAASVLLGLWMGGCGVGGDASGSKRHHAERSATSLHERGVEALRRGASREAVELLEAAVQAEPEVPDHHAELGWAYWSRADFARAVEQWEAAEAAGAAPDAYFFGWIDEARARRDGRMPQSHAPFDPGRPQVDSRVLRLALAGEVFPGGQQSGSTDERVPPDDGRELLKAAERFLLGADLAMADLATACADQGRLNTCEGGLPGCRTSRSPERLCASLVRSGLTLLSLQAPAARGLGERGLTSTQRLLEKHSAAVFGLAAEPVQHKVGTMTVAAFAIGGHDGLPKPDDLGPLLDAMAAQTEATVYVSVHRSGTLAEDFAPLATQLVEAGADLVVGHGGTDLGPLQLHKDRLIAHNLGTLVAYGATWTGDTGQAVVLNVDLASTGEFLGGTLTSLLRDADSVPREDPDGSARKHIVALSERAFPDDGQRPRIDQAGAVRPPL